jgi:hypothetical protein
MRSLLGDREIEPERWVALNALRVLAEEQRLGESL